MTFLKKIYWSSKPLRYLFRKYLKIKDYYLSTFLSDEAFTKNKFKTGMGYKLDLNNPITLNEKINWLILNDRTPFHTICADKYAVREHVTEKIGQKYIVPLVFHTTNANELKPEILPDYPFIIKANHNSSGYVIVKDKSKVDWEEVRKKFSKILKINYYKTSKQWQYKNIEPRIIVEKLLMDKDGNVPPDYKIHCFNGKVRMVSIDMNRGSENHSRTWFDRNWVLQPFSWSNKKAGGGYTDPSSDEIPKPPSFDLMIDLSEKLALDFDYVRVDWYNLNGVLYFGELTFHHSGGRCPILPKEWDTKLGQELKLIKSKHN